MLHRPIISISPQQVLEHNQLLSLNAASHNHANKPYQAPMKRQALFYYLLALTGFLAFLRYFFQRYFNTLFRVFFNTSFRQSQLTDQLLQAKLPSLLFNILFLLVMSFFFFQLVNQYYPTSKIFYSQLLFYCTVLLTVIYGFKNISTHFIGWLTGHREIAEVYVFVIFLINKIMGIVLLPLVIIICFGYPQLSAICLNISLALISALIILRFYRSFSILQDRIKMNRFHFFLYIAAVEILPILLLYKGLISFLSKNA